MPVCSLQADFNHPHRQLDQPKIAVPPVPLLLSLFLSPLLLFISDLYVCSAFTSLFLILFFFFLAEEVEYSS